MRRRINIGRDNRGSFILAFSGLTMALGMICATILLRSLDTYHVAQLSTRKIQSRAAAEGAAVLLLKAEAGSMREAVRLRDWTIAYSNGPDAATTATQHTLLNVALQPADKDPPRFIARYRATLVVAPDGLRRLDKLEMLP